MKSLPEKGHVYGAANLKWVIRSARVVGVHVSPTVFFNGVEERAISSGWTVEQWEEWLEKNVT